MKGRKRKKPVTLEWQPIETALKDGTWLLLYWAAPSPETRRPMVVGRYSDAGWTVEDGFDIEPHPTHWMLLPNPPEAR